MVHTGLQIRPEMFSLLLMTAIVFLWWKIKALSDDKYLYCYLFPLLILVWVNTHGAVIFGVAFLALLAFGEILNGFLSRDEMLSVQIRKHFFFSFILSLFSIFITPYWHRYPIYLMNNLVSNRDAYKHIIEFNSIFTEVFKDDLFVELGFISLMIVAFLLLSRFGRRKIDWSFVVPSIFFIALYVRFLRTTYFWGIIFVFGSISALSSLAQGNASWFYRSRLVKFSSICAIIFLAIFSSYKSIHSEMFGLRVDPRSPQEEAAYVCKNFPGENVGNDYDSGAYLLWTFGPANKVFIDSRYFPYLSWIQEYWDLFSPDENIDEMEENNDQISVFMEKYQCNVWCVSYYAPKLYTYLLESPQWNLVHFGPTGCVFASVDLDVPDKQRLFEDNIYSAVNGRDKTYQKWANESLPLRRVFVFNFLRV